MWSGSGDSPKFRAGPPGVEIKNVLTTTFRRAAGRAMCVSESQDERSFDWRDETACRVVADDDDRQVGFNPRFGQVSYTLEQFGFNGVCARFAVDSVRCHVLANGRVYLRIGMQTALSQRRFETQCTHNAPSCSGLPNGKGSAKHGAEDGVPPESKRDGSGGKKPGKNQGPEDAGQSTKESGSLPFTVDVALQHGQRGISI